MASEVTVIRVGQHDLREGDLLALARARVVMGPEDLLRAVRHLCPPAATLTATGGATAVPPPSLAQGSVVVLEHRVDSP